MLHEIAVERYAFECGQCRRTWIADYDVRYVTGAEGTLWAFYHRDAVAVDNPADNPADTREIDRLGRECTVRPDA